MRRSRHGKERGVRPRPRVVIVGGGFAGLNAARALRRADADITIVDGHDYHTFQPLLYQVSTGYLAPEEVGAALRAIFRRQANVRVRIGQVARLDHPAHALVLQDGSTLPLDYLIMAAGAETNFFGVPGMREIGWPLYTLPDAIRLRRHLLSTLEQATAGPAPAPINVVVAGGGSTGVETAGALTAMARELAGPAATLRVADGSQLRKLAQRFADGQLEIPVAASYRLAAAAHALAHATGGHAAGAFVLTP